MKNKKLDFCFANVRVKILQLFIVPTKKGWKPQSIVPNLSLKKLIKKLPASGQRKTKNPFSFLRKCLVKLSTRENKSRIQKKWFIL